ncbi:uncharacterized protein LOC134097755 isoform X1 [Sardina pilchardus]|uniref:uncharacterized protein LOC134097755 isoform X1 n=1 Tax=Sardina pilchardus TaxID=27697 RepID=UPI002E0E66A0
MTAVRLALVLLLCLTHSQPGKCGVKHVVYSKERDDVKIPCNNVAVDDCSSTTWVSMIAGSKNTAEEVSRGKINFKVTNRTDRLKLEPDCSLKIINVTSQDAGEYLCRQYLTDDGDQNGVDDLVYLSVLSVSSSIPASQMKADTNVTFYCKLAAHKESQDEHGGPKLVWIGFDQQQVKKANPYEISPTRTLTKEDNNRKLQCKVTWKGELKATVDYTINLGQDGSHPVGLIGAVIGTVAVALCAFLLFLWRRKAKQRANMRFENVSANVPKEKTEDKRKTSGQSKQAPGDQGITYAEITIKADTRKSSDKPTFQHETEYSTIKTI